MAQADDKSGGPTPAPPASSASGGKPGTVTAGAPAPASGGGAPGVAATGKAAAAAPELAARIHTWPYLVRIELIAAVIVMVVLTAWSILIDAPLEEPANPNHTPNPSKAPWYFLGLQEMLVYFDPWIAGVLLPVLIIVGLMVIPYIDVNPRGSGYYTWTERRFAIGTFLFGFLALWIALIVIGTFFRGPGWNLFWPGERWDPHRSVVLQNVDLPVLLGAGSVRAQRLVGGLLVLGWWPGLAIAGWALGRRRPFFQQLGRLRYHILAFLLLGMGALVVKIILRLTLNVKYVWAIPELNLNF